MSQARGKVSPLKLRASLHATIWGGRNLATVARKSLPPDVDVGESWETEVGNVVENGAYAGMTLGQVVMELDQALLGTRAIELFGHRFPLLAKFIDARENLSVQVHPNDAQAQEFAPGKLGKTEAWYILRAEPAAKLVLGFQRAVSEEEVRRAVGEHRLEDLLHTFAVHSGDVVFVPSGTVHAIGGGVVLYELQEYSDITYRLYDYGRRQRDGQPRELHVQQALQVMKFEPLGSESVRPVPLRTQDEGVQRRILVACQYFALEEIIFSGSMVTTTASSSCEILSILDGPCSVVATKGTPLALE
ncbi:MAG TPA: type I phosphomannose isomerase catalytic subunit, partial [Ktedonobacterales bacterium]|nr:type I phosphomannose isomerase catalytic subunit [Ktedonobacterales bacterium]